MILGVVNGRRRLKFDAQFVVDASDATGNYTPTINGGVTVSAGQAHFNNASTDYINYAGTELRMQGNVEFEIRFKVTAKGGVHHLMTTLTQANALSGPYIFVNDSLGVVAFYITGGVVLSSATVPIGVFTTVKCVIKRGEGIALIYVDGVLQTTAELVNPANLLNIQRKVHLGTQSPSSGAQPLFGDIEYLKITEF